MKILEEKIGEKISNNEKLREIICQIEVHIYVSVMKSISFEGQIIEKKKSMFQIKIYGSFGSFQVLN